MFKNVGEFERFQLLAHCDFTALYAHGHRELRNVICQLMMPFLKVGQGILVFGRKTSCLSDVFVPRFVHVQTSELFVLSHFPRELND